MHEALASAPAGARSILAALTWGPPVGRMPSTADGPTAAPTRWLLEHGFVRKADAHHVLLPREVALALREGRTHRGLSTPPQLPPATLDPATVEAESARAAQEITRLVADLVALWQETPAATLRSGGLGVRDLRRLGLRLEVDERTAAFVVELAAMAGLVVDDGDDPASYAPTLDADDWLADDLPRRWTTLVTAWHSSARTPWLVGSRDERGALRSALEPELHRAWVPRLRSEVLGVLHAAPGAPVTADQITAVLRWRAPRAVPPHEAVDALLVESALLGVTGAGALSAAGAVLADVPVLTVADDAARTALASAMGAALPEAVDDLLLQGDQTGIVPGRPSPALEALLADSAVVESRGSAITVRFTPESVTRALDAGRTGEELLAELAVHSRSGVPQPLEYLVRDAARRHGQLRLGAASAYVRVEDPVLLAGLVEDPAPARPRAVPHRADCPRLVGRAVPAARGAPRARSRPGDGGPRRPGGARRPPHPSCPSRRSAWPPPGARRRRLGPRRDTGPSGPPAVSRRRAAARRGAGPRGAGRRDRSDRPAEPDSVGRRVGRTPDDHLGVPAGPRAPAGPLPAASPQVAAAARTARQARPPRARAPTPPRPPRASPVREQQNLSSRWHCCVRRRPTVVRCSSTSSALPGT